MKFLSFLITLLLLSSINAQRQTDTIFFETNSDLISFEEKQKLHKIPVGNVSLEGHTDSEGNAQYNLNLSERRVLAVKQLLIANGHKEPDLSLSYFGENKPLKLQQVESVKALNRCVLVSYQILETLDASQKSYEFPAPIPFQQSFLNKDGVSFEMPNGVKITIEPYSFTQNSEAQIELKVTSYLSKKDFILANLHSMAGDTLLESAGMFKIEASSENKVTNLKSSAKIEIKVPNKTKKQDFELFYGHETPSSNPNTSINWVHSEPNIGSNQFFDNRGSFVIEGEKKVYKLSENKRGGLIIALGGMRSPIKTKYFKVDRNTINYALKSQFSPVRFKVLLTVEEGKVTTSEIQTTSGRLSNKVEKSLLKVFQKDIWKRRLNKSLTLNFDYRMIVISDIITYVDVTDSLELEEASLDVITMSVSKLGWINCDRFYDAKNKKPLYVDTDPMASVRLVFTDFNGIINGTYKNGKGFYFGEIPEDESYTILAYKEDGDGVNFAKSNSEDEANLQFSLVSREKFVAMLSAL